MEYYQAVQLAARLGIEVIEDIDKEVTSRGYQVHGIYTFLSDGIRIRPSLSDARKTHVLLHEIAHATGSERRLNRETLTAYGCDELYELVEETVSESAAITMLYDSEEPVFLGGIRNLSSHCDSQGIDWKHDIEPEVERILDYLQPYLREVYRCRKTKF